MLICIPAADNAYQDLGNGELYKLHATKDVFLAGNDNQAHHNSLIVGKHPLYEKKTNPDSI